MTIFSSLSSGVYHLKNGLEEYDVYCHMTEIPGCGKGGWTLVIKMDGEKVLNIGKIRITLQYLTIIYRDQKFGSGRIY